MLAAGLLPLVCHDLSSLIVLCLGLILEGDADAAGGGVGAGAGAGVGSTTGAGAGAGFTTDAGFTLTAKGFTSTSADLTSNGTGLDSTATGLGGASSSSSSLPSETLGSDPPAGMFALLFSKLSRSGKTMPPATPSTMVTLPAP
mmetsp:Transcript_3203/g.6003  ORF Transcript_3203/g.6003 Transcript_3203/m.6003 type:complete len:144 (+) Transcript_3203:109-540(+)